MADFKTTLGRLARGETEFDSVAGNIEKLLSKNPGAAVALMDQLKQAVVEDVIDTELYARLRECVTKHVEAVPAGGVDADSADATVFAPPDKAIEEVFDVTSGRDGVADQATEFAPPPPNAAGADEATEIAGATVQGEAMSGQTTGIDFDLTGDSGPSTSSSWPSGGTQTGQTGTDWAQPGGEAPASTKLGPGGVLRGRFELTKVLGEGGMGAVYLGQDLIKVRAKDRKPEVALKVLNENFKDHPDSFIALQREASRQQKLAHPNIATVYDFDQTEDGLAFLVMEVLDGEALNDFIKKKVRPKGGLPFEEAFPMVEGLGHALVYAHERSIVHSDFKPGNCFITKENVMKVLDFGIARAVKAPEAAEGEVTLFDPGKLGALTPAYASLEMLEGEEPDPRDDIYALACVAYELLTGKHPFNKIPANKARDAGLSPDPIKGLSRKQWRGLARGLAFERADRSQTTAQFLEEFEGATSPWKNPFIMVPSVAALILVAGFFPAKNYLERRDIDARIAQAQSGDPAQIESVLTNLEVDDVDPEQRDRLFTAAKDQILAYFEQKARNQIDIDRGNYDYTGARKTLGQARQLSSVFQDSSVLLRLERDIDESENRLFAEQFDKFNRSLEAGSLLAVEGEEDIFDAMAIVRQVDPGHPMLKDRRIPGAFATEINRALENEDYDYADELGQVGLQLIPNSANLTNLTDKIAGERDRAETRGRILRAIAEIENAKASGGNLADYVGVGPAVADLSRVDPGNELIEALRKTVRAQASKDLGTLESTRNWGQSGLMTGDFRSLLRGLGLHELNARAVVLGDEFDSAVGLARSAVTNAVAESTPADAVGALDKLESIAPISERTQNARDQVAAAFMREAYAARDAGEFEAAERALQAAAKLGPRGGVAARIVSETSRIDAERGLDADARAALVARRKATLESELSGFRDTIGTLGGIRPAYDAAFDKLVELESLAPGDSRLADLEAELADRIRQDADAMGAEGRWDDAVGVTRAALIALPRASDLAANLEPLEAARKQALIEQEKQLVADSKRELDGLLANPSGDRNWRASIRQKIENIIALGEPDDAWLPDNGARLAEIYIDRAKTMRGEQRFAEGANLLADVQRFVPAAPGLAEEQAALAAATEAFEREQEEQARLARIDGLKETFQTQARANDVSGAQKSLDALRTELGDQADPFIDKDAPRMLAGAYYKLATQKAATADFAAALRFAKACAQLQPSRLDCKNAVRDYTVDGNIQDLKKIVTQDTFDLNDVLTRVSEVQILDPGRFGSAEGDWAPAIARRLESLKDEIGTEANPIIEQAQTVFAGNQMIAAIAPVRTTVAPSQYAGEIVAAMDKALLGEARKLIKQASRTEAEHPDIVRLKGTFNARLGEAKKLYESYKEQYTNGKFEDALTTMEKALTVWADSGTFAKEHARVVAKLDAQRGATGEVGTVKPKVIAAALPPTNPCEAKLAGHGKRRKGTCFYFVSGSQRGPTMVVVPPGEGFASAFAIGKYEVTVSDYNRYCFLTDACSVDRETEGRLPKTGLSLNQAQEYVKWLSERTGQTFRLPTAQEWTYAANAAGDQPKKDYNCRLEQGGQVVKGLGTMGVNTGRPNGWGLHNYIGNVQEWAMSGSSVVARGGAFQDTFSKCDIALEKAHSGQADGATGFRVLLELN